MALEGTIRDFGLPDIFQLIGLQRKTGLLTLVNERDDESVTVTFENGMVVMADSSARRLEDRLGNVLVKQGKITRERLDEALGVQRQTLQRLGHVLATAAPSPRRTCATRCRCRSPRSSSGCSGGGTAATTSPRPRRSTTTARTSSR
jgi:hypothetical protein